MCPSCNVLCLFGNKEICALCEKDAFEHRRKTIPASEINRTRVKTPDELAKEAQDDAENNPPHLCAGICGELVRGKWQHCKACISAVIDPYNEEITEVTDNISIAPLKLVTMENVANGGYTKVIRVLDGSVEGALTNFMYLNKPGFTPAWIECKVDHYDLEDSESKGAVDGLKRLLNEVTGIFEIKKLYHCKAGVSRSASLVIGELMRMGFSFRTAYCYLHSLRPILNINKGFIAALMEFESNKAVVTARERLDKKYEEAKQKAAQDERYKREAAEREARADWEAANPEAAAEEKRVADEARKAREAANPEPWKTAIEKAVEGMSVEEMDQFYSRNH